jgi:phosphoglycolate phosphatase
MLKLLVFDWDGTLMDSGDRIVSCVSAAVAELGLPPRAPQAVRDVIGLGLREAWEALYPGLGETLLGDLTERYRRHFLVQDTTPMPLFPGVTEVLTDLRAEGYLLAVATGKSRRGLDRALEETALGGLFAATRCADETRSKPHPQMLLEVMSELGAEAEQTLMIGDSEYDLRMAVDAGVGALAVAYGVKDCRHLLEFQPLGCLEAIGDLPAWLRQRRAARAAGEGGE